MSVEEGDIVKGPGARAYVYKVIAKDTTKHVVRDKYGNLLFFSNDHPWNKILISKL